MSELLPPKKSIVVALLVICLAVVGLAVIDHYNIRGSSRMNSFQEYKPLTLLSGTNIMGRYTNMWTHENNPSGEIKQLDLYLSDSGTSSIIEQKNINFAYTCKTSSEESQNVTCVIAETPQHQRYRLTTAYTYNQTVKHMPFEQEAEWLRGDTYIGTTLQGSPVQTYSLATWGRVIDSFVPTHYDSLPVKHYVPGP